MTIISLFGVLLGLLAIPLFLKPKTFSRLALAIFVIMVHVAVTQVYYFYTLTNRADAYAYYFAGSYWDSLPWTALSTGFVGHATQFLRNTFQATYEDCFMIFQASGAWGLMILMRTFEEIRAKTMSPPTPLEDYVLFLPSLHFWTCAIGKDGPMFLAVGLAVWSALNLSRRVIPLIIALGIMVLFRAHIALAVALSLAVAALLHSQFSAGRKAILFVIGLVGTGILLVAVGSTFHLDVTDPSSYADLIDKHEMMENGDRGTSSIKDAPYIVRMLSVLFRPLFFDIHDSLGLIASVENVGSVLLFCFLLLHMKDTLFMAKRVLFIKFLVVFSLVMIAMLTFITYNIGLGLRERTMAIGPVLCLFFAVRAFDRLRRGAQPLPAMRGARPVSARPAAAAPDQLPAG
ncbi:MAG: hypothetical protein ACM3ZV_11405 [Bacillota bacterium]